MKVSRKLVLVIVCSMLLLLLFVPMAVQAQQAEWDFGDAPDSYGTLLASGGASHPVSPGYCLGTNIDSELDGQPSIPADGDDINLLYAGMPFPPGDEDGVVFTSPLVMGQNANITVTQTAPPRGHLLPFWMPG
ncbi:hypothetical protein ACFLU8_04020 [Chloroflexota bacterium]